jgi:undecaprenyl pyrophosphate phosphatase UppP
MPVRLQLVPLILLALAVVFFALALLDVRKHGSKSSPARKTWLRVGLIFAFVSGYLLIFQGRVP